MQVSEILTDDDGNGLGSDITGEEVAERLLAGGDETAHLVPVYARACLYDGKDGTRVSRKGQAGCCVGGGGGGAWWESGLALERRFIGPVPSAGLWACSPLCLAGGGRCSRRARQRPGQARGGGPRRGHHAACPAPPWSGRPAPVWRRPHSPQRLLTRRSCCGPGCPGGLCLGG